MGKVKTILLPEIWNSCKVTGKLKTIILPEIWSIQGNVQERDVLQLKIGNSCKVTVRPPDTAE